MDKDQKDAVADGGLEFTPEEADWLNQLQQAIRRDNQNLAIAAVIVAIFGIGLALAAVGAVWWVLDRSDRATDSLIEGGILILIAVGIGIAIRLFSQPTQTNHMT